MTQTYAIIGAGQAGLAAAEALRRLGFGGRIALYGGEPELPYQRPPLSKSFLSGAFARARLFFKPESFYREHEIDLRLGARVEEIMPRSKELRLAGGGRASFSRALLATGGAARRLDLPGCDLDGFFCLRSLADAEQIRARLQEARRLVVVGGGYIGLEIAASARLRGLEVAVLEARPRLLSRVTSPVIADFFRARHARAGVQIFTGVSPVRIEGAKKVTGVRSRDGALHPADLVVAGVGLVPETALAARAGLALDNGIATDGRARTSDSDIFAAGDCASQPSPLYGRRIRLESVHNAITQAQTAAAAMCGAPLPGDSVPWFWSDQYDVKLQIAGLAAGYDRVVLRGRPESGRFSAFYLSGGRLIGADSINRPADYLIARHLIAAQARPDPERIADTAIPPKQIAGQ